jgi:acetyl-CoA carboxylase biotin carboxyl carrier protein
MADKVGGRRSRRGGRSGAEAGGGGGPAARTNGNAGGAGQSMIDLDFLRGLIQAVDQSGIDSLEITRAGTRIRVAKTPPPASVAMVAGGTGEAQRAAVATSVEALVPASGGGAGGGNPAGGAGASPAAPAAPAAPATNRVDVASPMVGTFYRAPAPEAPPYVEIGSHVRKGQTLCILEAMKLMNELEAEVDGVVREVLVGNGEPVEYGQVLFRIEPGAGG